MEIQLKSICSLVVLTLTCAVAESANVHQNVEAKALPGAEGSQQFVMASPMAQPEVDDLVAQFLSASFHGAANLSVRIVAVLIKQRRCQFDFQRIVFQ